MGQLPLPEANSLFREALTKPGALDESDLHRWKVEPPFVEDEDTTDPFSERYLRFNQSLAYVLHGVRLREQNEQDTERRLQFSGDGSEAAKFKVCQEIDELLSGWRRVKALSIYHPFHHSREYTMQQHYLQWLARTIYHLYHLKFLAAEAE
ncbi:hypothetical protein B0H15DRAFT_802880 [Mycena belliarum]|uniref:Uncharacterized protein n=1 Tax=Mycena belliarum TaxID=1033014 RepID=A0AAD6XLJ9_9AGAR|nr:hypothetical protein B0H15DRAFT_802880 [Mycena belliae]